MSLSNIILCSYNNSTNNIQSGITEWASNLEIRNRNFPSRNDKALCLWRVAIYLINDVYNYELMKQVIPYNSYSLS